MELVVGPGDFPGAGGDHRHGDQVVVSFGDGIAAGGVDEGFVDLQIDVGGLFVLAGLQELLEFGDESAELVNQGAVGGGGDESGGLDLEAFADDGDVLELAEGELFEADAALRVDFEDSFLFESPDGLGDGDDGHAELGGELAHGPGVVVGELVGDDHHADFFVGDLTFRLTFGSSHLTLVLGCCYDTVMTVAGRPEVIGRVGRCGAYPGAASGSTGNRQGKEIVGMALQPKHPGRVTERAMELLREVVEYGFGNSSGPGMVGRFEAAFAKRFGAPYAIGLCNGTATMHCCLAAAGVEPGEEVIVPPLTAAATAFCVLHQGAVPVFADIDARTFNIDPNSIAERITPLTRAIIPVGLYGLSADMDPIMEIAKAHNLTVIEDNAECLLGQYKGRLAGTTGHMASFSLQASKHISCGDGGIVTTSDLEYANMVRRFSCVGFRTLGATRGGTMSKQDRGHPSSLRHDFLGWNYRMSDLQGAVALEQTERMDELVDLRMKIAAMYLEAIDGCGWLCPQYTPPEYVNSYWTFVCRFDPEKAGCSWDQFRQRFWSLGGDFLYGAWQLTYNEPVFQNRRFLGSFPIDSEIYKGRYRDYSPGLCPVAESLQPHLMQFKTNYMDLNVAAEQAKALKNTIAAINAER